MEKGEVGGEKGEKGERGGRGGTSQTGMVQTTHALTLSPLMCPGSEHTSVVRLMSCSQ